MQPVTAAGGERAAGPGTGTPATRPGCPQAGSRLLATRGRGPVLPMQGGRRAPWGGPRRTRRTWAATEYGGSWKEARLPGNSKFLHGAHLAGNSSFQGDWPDPADLSRAMRKPRPNRLAKAHKSMISPSSEVMPPTLMCTVRQRKRFEEFAPSERAALAVSGHPEETTSFLVRTRTSEFLTLATILRFRNEETRASCC